MPTLKFATHLLLADTQENFTYMNLDFSKQKDRKIEVVEKNKKRLIDIETITYLECDGYITTIYTLNNNHICTSKLLLHFEEELTIYGFIRANRSTIVNLKHISEIQLNCGRKIIKINQLEVKISRRKSHLF